EWFSTCGTNAGWLMTLFAGAAAQLVGTTRSGARHPWRRCRRAPRSAPVGAGEPPDLAGECEQVVRRVQHLGARVQLVEDRTDERGLADVLADADRLGVGGSCDRRVAAIGEADGGRLEWRLDPLRKAEKYGPTRTDAMVSSLSRWCRHYRPPRTG